MPQRIVLTGGPSTGKTAIIQALEAQGQLCMQEISREVTRAARQQGIEQLFVSDPLAFSEALFAGRKNQFIESGQIESPRVFLDRGIIDVVAYLRMVKTPYPDYFDQAIEEHRYDAVFYLPPWEEIYQSDQERYEDFSLALEIDHHLKATYTSFGYSLHFIEPGSVDSRIQSIFEVLNSQP